MLLLALACNPCPSDAVCLDEGYYLVDRPDEPNGDTLLWIHGWNEDAEHLRGRAPEHAALLAAGWTILQPYGGRENWHFDTRDDAGSRDDVAFLEEVIDDEKPTGDVLVAGHSVGASMASELACTSDQVDALNAFSGTFWDPMPEGCDSTQKPVRHVHGTADAIWPMDGKAFFGMRQGAVEDGVALWRSENECTADSTQFDDGPNACEVWTCSGAEVSLCLNDGEHRMQGGFGERMDAWWSSL